MTAPPRVARAGWESWLGAQSVTIVVLGSALTGRATVIEPALALTEDRSREPVALFAESRRRSRADSRSRGI